MVLDRLAEAGSCLLGIDEQYVERFLDVCQANLRAIRRFRPSPIDCPVLLVRASERGRDEFRRPEFGSDDLGWRSVVGKPLEAAAMPGNHVSMLSGDHAKAAAESPLSFMNRTAPLDGVDPASTTS